MSRLQTTLLVVLTAAVVLGMALPAGAVVEPAEGADQTAQQSAGQTISVGAGQQLSTVLAVTGEEVRTEAAAAGFEQQLNKTAATQKGELIAERATALAERATELRDRYDELTAALRDGDIDGVEYAQRIASLTTQVTAVETGVTRVTERAATVPDAERQALNITATDLGQIADEAAPLSGQTPDAVLSQFTGEVDGEIEITVNAVLEIEVTNENGDQSTQIERPRDRDGDNEDRNNDSSRGYALNQSDALAIATDALSEPSQGAWVLTSISADDSAYELEFVFQGPGDGEAEVAVDGQTGTVFEFEESIEAPGEDEGDDGENNNDKQLAIQVTDGDPGPGAEITLTVTRNGEPVSGVTVELEENVVGTTGENGSLTLTLPGGEADIKAADGEAEGESEDEDEDENDESENENSGEERPLGATADIENGTVTVSVLLGNDPLENATVTANQESIGATGPDGTVSFSLPDQDELEIKIEYNDREAELEYELENGQKENEQQEGQPGNSEDTERLTLEVTEGEPAPGAEVTLAVTENEEPASNASVELNGNAVGSTDSDGSITLTLPDTDAEIKLTDGEAEGEVEFEFENEDEETENEDTEDEETENED
ncbi:MAG: hypothetical protein J07HX5_01913, partial [halophilic archaeon J07HX5]